jgi:protein KRI1
LYWYFSDDLLRVRHRTREELVKDEEETAVAVAEAERRKKDQDISKKLEDYFGKKDDDLDANERFLKDFFLNEGWIDKDRNRVPSYRDVVGEVSEDEAHLEETDKYEAEFNFRFQENAGAQVLGNPRVVEGTVRKQGEKRKTQRQKKAERLAEEKRAREEDLKRLKNLKKKEIIEKLEKIRTVAGATAGLTSLGEDVLEEDFDPEEYDSKMQEAFGDSYYQEEDAEIGSGADEEEGIIEKPNFDDEDEELGLPTGWDKKVGFAAAHKTQKVSFKDKIAVDKNLEEYYKLDCEDMIGDLPTRFKYREVKRNTYGLDVADILTADDKELNQHVSIKKLAPYRAEWEAPKYSTLSQKARKKQALQDGPSQSVRKFSKKKPYEKKKELKKKDTVESAPATVADGVKESGSIGEHAEAEGEKKSKKRKRKMKKSGPLSFLPPSRVEAYGALPTPEKKKKKKSTAA